MIVVLGAAIKKDINLKYVFFIHARNMEIEMHYRIAFR
jgi:hypothetical protein